VHDSSHESSAAPFRGCDRPYGSRPAETAFQLHRAVERPEHDGIL